MMRKVSLVLAGAIAGAGLTGLATQTGLLSSTSAVAASAEVYRSLNLFGDIFEKIRTDYVEKPDEQKLIEAAINGARLWLEMRDNGEDFSTWLWSFVDGQPQVNQWSHFREAPTQTPESVAMAKALKARGFKFCGPVITYAFMQAVGMVNDHQTTCFRHGEVGAMRDTVPL